MDEDAGSFGGRRGAGVIARVRRECARDQQMRRPRLLLRDDADPAALAVIYHVLAPVPVAQSNRERIRLLASSFIAAPSACINFNNLYTRAPKWISAREAGGLPTINVIM